MKKRLFAYFLCLLLLLCGICGCDGTASASPPEGIVPSGHAPSVTSPRPTPAPTATPAPTPTATPNLEPVTITLAAVGDLMIHEAQFVSAKKGDTYDFSEYFEFVKDELSGADFTVGNLECPTTGEAPVGYPCFNAPVEFLDELCDAGFDAVTLANNHILDKRAAGIEKTVDNVESRGLLYFGAWREGERDVTVADVNGVKIALLGYAQHTNGHDDTKNQVDALTEKNIKRDVEKAREKGADIIIAFPHWGDEDTAGTTSGQRKYAKLLADAGVDVVLGSHPHVLQPFVTVAAQDGREVPVMYSMGNFISNQQKAPNFTGVIVKLQITKDMATGETEITSVGYMPTFVYKTNGKAKYTYQIIPVDADEKALIPDMTDTAKRKLKRARSYSEEVLGDSFAERLEPMAD